ncbi:MAG: ATP synthase F1 subunit delta [Peptococcaceae bacterium]|jgi:ATP synthase F1 delta subunit|nr:ATP synthase F1 subunit delta [Peptococcaceae bacterium]
MLESVSYAEALFEAASESQCLDETAKELQSVGAVLERRMSAFRNPGKTSRDHKRFFSETLDGKVNRITLRFLFLLADHRKLPLLPDIVRRYEGLVRKASGERWVRLSAAIELNEPILTEMKAYLIRRGLIEKETSHDQIFFESVLDRGLLGGFRAEYEGRMLDESLKTRLRAMRLESMRF